MSNIPHAHELPWKKRLRIHLGGASAYFDYEQRRSIAVLEARVRELEACDCVPSLISSRACQKCGRKGVIPQEQLVKVRARVRELEEAIRRHRDEKWHDNGYRYDDWDNLLYRTTGFHPLFPAKEEHGWMNDS